MSEWDVFFDRKDFCRSSILFGRYHSIPIRDLLDLSLCGEMECLIVYSLLNETMLKIFRDYRVSFNFEWISSDLRETCVRCIYVRELFFIFLVNYYLQNNNFDDLDFF